MSVYDRPGAKGRGTYGAKEGCTRVSSHIGCDVMGIRHGSTRGQEPSKGHVADDIDQQKGDFGRWQSDFRKIIEHCLEDGVPGEEVARILQPDEDYGWSGSWVASRARSQVPKPLSPVSSTRHAIGEKLRDVPLNERQWTPMARSSEEPASGLDSGSSFV